MTASNSTFLDVAAQIGRGLCRDALWADDKCTWLGWTLEPTNTAPLPTYRAQPAEVGDGSAGIGLFLARLWQHIGDSLVRQTALGALRQATAAVVDQTPERVSGFFAGRPGVGAAMIEAGDILDDEILAERGLEVLVSFSRQPVDAELSDVMSGSAGAIPALLDGAARFGNDDLMAAALAHGEILIENADKTGQGWSWRHGEDQTFPNLLGYAHGAAGVVCALMELYAVTGEDRFLVSARRGLAYERAQFDVARGNWPDLRIGSDAPHLAVAVEARYPVAWNYGAVGIGFSRLRIRELSDDEEGVAEELETAINAAVLTVSPHTLPVQNFSLANGAAGTADFLLMSAEALPRRSIKTAPRWR